MNYVVLGAGDVAPNHSRYDCFCYVLYSGVECHYPVSLLILQLMSYFIMMLITNITDIFLYMATPFELQIKAFWN